MVTFVYRLDLNNKNVLFILFLSTGMHLTAMVALERYYVSLSLLCDHLTLDRPNYALRMVPGRPSWYVQQTPVVCSMS